MIVIRRYDYILEMVPYTLFRPSVETPRRALRPPLCPWPEHRRRSRPRDVRGTQVDHRGWPIERWQVAVSSLWPEWRVFLLNFCIQGAAGPHLGHGPAHAVLSR